MKVSRENSHLNLVINVLLALALTFLVQGCSAINNHAVLAITGTNIGLELSQNPATQSPQGKLGYNRSEYAYVPTNRPNTKEILDIGVKCTSESPCTVPSPLKLEGANESTDVLMELKYAGIFSWGDGGGIYQRLAVGKTAVQQAGAALMFARDGAGEMTKDTANAVAKAIANVKKISPVSEGVEANKAQIMKCNRGHAGNTTKQATIETAIKKQGYASYGKFMSSKPSLEQVNNIMNDKEVKKICTFK